MKTGFISVLAVLLLVGVGCRSAAKKEAPPATLAERVGLAHGIDAWRGQKALSGRMAVAFANQPLLEMTFVHEVHSGRTRMQLADGTVLVWDGQRAWVSPATSAFPMARFHLLTWPYFMAAPFKLQDPGVKLTEPAEGTLSGKTFLTSRMTFAPGTGDAPDDWYVVYADPQSARLEGLAYVVTYGKTLAKAEEEPHAITYYDFKRVEGVLIPHEWRFWNWNKTAGLYGQPLGRAVLSNLEFVTPKENAFVKPKDAKEDGVPQKAGG